MTIPEGAWKYMIFWMSSIVDSYGALRDEDRRVGEHRGGDDQEREESLFMTTRQLFTGAGPRPSALR